ncbi:hypothetical protein GGU11DRAFT_759982 [Lentinula aff. detonsa]|nr:hypothetical protein GGU11DRAFT_759982 [Lentinula aff. detonsa]
MASEPTSSYNIAPAGGFKKRRLANACDICRSKKIRCKLTVFKFTIILTFSYLQGDSAKMPGNICSNCRAFPDKLELGILLYSLNVCFKKAVDETKRNALCLLSNPSEVAQALQTELSPPAVRLVPEPFLAPFPYEGVRLRCCGDDFV